MTIFGIYKTYPFRVPARVKFFNIFRYIFKFAFSEKYLVARLAAGSRKFWNKFIPPLYFYRSGSFRTAERGNIKFRLDISKQLDHSIYFYAIKDVAWENLFKILRPDFNVIDVGANIGLLSLTFASRCPQGIIYSFEPDSETFQKLYQNVNLNSFNNIKLFRQAIGARKTTGKLYKLYASNPGANRILQDKPAVSVPSELVEIDTLDQYDQLGYFSGVDLIKIDVEGFELFVLEGARDLINRWTPILFVELVEQNLKQQGCSANSLLQYVRQLGYVILDAKTMHPLKSSDHYYTDIICFPQSTKE